ncbi:MAG: hypothetical protein M1401_01280 [Chloroflexi bacterium]|nr:hypothetical protein [Chloroflexota bacterium]MCL5107510.1 hypothetical protein [Chloroflexota bacterium]
MPQRFRPFITTEEARQLDRLVSLAQFLQRYIVALALGNEDRPTSDQAKERTMTTARLGRLVGLCLLALTLATACAPSTPNFPIALTPAPPLRATPRPPTAVTPLPPVSPPAAPLPTPVTGNLPPVDENSAVRNVLAGMSELRRRMQQMALGAPQADELVSVTQQTVSLMAAASQVMPQMNLLQREQAFQQEVSLVDGLMRMSSSHEQLTLGHGPSAETSGIGTLLPLTVAGMPRSLPQGGLSPLDQLIGQEMAIVDDRASQLARGEVTGSELLPTLSSFRSTLLTTRQLSSRLSPQQAQQVAARAAVTMQSLVNLVRSFGMES